MHLIVSYLIMSFVVLAIITQHDKRKHQRQSTATQCVNVEEN